MHEADRIQALEDLHRRWAGAIYDKCRWMLGDPRAAEDAVQEVFLKAYELLPKVAGRPQEALLPWLYRIATNVCLHALRSRRRKGLLPAGDALEETVAVDGQQDRAAFARQALARLLDQLDDRGIEIVVAAYLDGMTQAEIAQSIGISRRAVVKRLAALRAKVAPIFAEEP